MKILVAEDNQDQLFVRSLLLRQNGFEPLEAADLDSALEHAVKHRPKCALIDLRLPTEEAGLRLIRELKAIDSEIRLVVLTGANSQGLAGHSEKDLIDELVVKGSPTKQLIQKLKALAA